MLNINHKRERENPISAQSSLSDQEEDIPTANQASSSSEGKEITSNCNQQVKKKKLMDNVNMNIVANNIDIINTNNNSTIFAIPLNPIENFFIHSAGAAECKKIGDMGGFGDVYMVRIGDTIKAVKHIRQLSNSYSGFEEVFQIAKLNHEHIIEIDDYHFIGSDFCFEMGYYEKGSLIKYKNKLSVMQLFQIACQMCDALKYISERGVCHRDVKIANILVKDISDSNIQVVLTDFGLSFRKNSYKPYKYAGGTEQYYDPSIKEYFNLTEEERKNREFPYKTETDLYALGVTIQRLSNIETINDTPLLKEIIMGLKSTNHEERINWMNHLAHVSYAMKTAFKNPKNTTQWDRYLEACSINSNCFRFCPYHNNHFVKSVLKRNSSIIQFASDDQLEDNDLLDTAIRTNLLCIVQIHDRIKVKNKEVVSRMMENRFHELRHAHAKIDYSIMSLDVLKILVIYIPVIIEYFPDSYKLVKDHVMTFIESNPKCYDYCKFLDDEEVTKFAIEKDVRMILKSSKRLRMKYEPQLARKIIEIDAIYYSNLSDFLRSDRDMSKLAVLSNSDNYYRLSDQMKKDQQLLIELVRENPNIFEMCKKNLNVESLVQLINPTFYLELDRISRLDEHILRKLLSENISSVIVETILKSLKENNYIGSELFKIIPKETVLHLIYLGVPLNDLSYFNQDLDFVLKLLKNSPKRYVNNQVFKSLSLDMSNITVDILQEITKLPEFYSIIELLDCEELAHNFSHEIELVTELVRFNPKLYEYLDEDLSRKLQSLRPNTLKKLTLCGICCGFLKLSFMCSCGWIKIMLSLNFGS